MGRNWAIAIGINHYDNLQPLRYAQRDAEAMCAYFRGEAGFEQVYYFSDDSPVIAAASGPPIKSQPTFGTLSRFLRVRFEQPFLNAGDNFWFFFAGHGKRHRDRDYLMPMDADPGNIEGTAIAINYVTERLRRCGADNVILVLDACRNEGDRDGEGISGEAQQGVVTLFGCSPSERSYEIEALQQGAFTHVLLRALRIQGEGNCATVERLCNYLRYQVPALNRHYNKPSQTPYSQIEPETKLHLILLPKQATLTDVTTLKNDALEAEAERNWELAEHLWTRVLAVSPADQQAIRAIKRIARADIATPPQSIAPLPSTDRSLAKARAKVAPIRDTVSPMPPATPTMPSFAFEVITVNAQGQEIHRRPGTAFYVTEDLGQDVCLEMVAIPGGRFQMGAPKTEAESYDTERPQHQVAVEPFLMGKYPVTQAQWQTVAALPKVKVDLQPDPAHFKGKNRPVEQVSWNEAVEFCDRLSRKTGKLYRLSSEAEWEYACRAGTTTPFHFGETLTPDLSNYDGSYTYSNGPKGRYREQTTDVGSFSPNAFGLHDMHGNVWEWCFDHWHDSYGGLLRQAPTDGNAWLSEEEEANRLLRGGSWFNYPENCRSVNRFRYTRAVRYNDIGFRVACAAPRTV
jgi:formylglycine-generating enzyme required for sulfatase activity